MHLPAKFLKKKLNEKSVTSVVQPFSKNGQRCSFTANLNLIPSRNPYMSVDQLFLSRKTLKWKNKICKFTRTSFVDLNMTKSVKSLKQKKKHVFVLLKIVVPVVFKELNWKRPKNFGVCQNLWFFNKRLSIANLERLKKNYPQKNRAILLDYTCLKKRLKFWQLNRVPQKEKYVLLPELEPTTDLCTG